MEWIRSVLFVKGGKKDCNFTSIFIVCIILLLP